MFHSSFVYTAALHASAIVVFSFDDAKISVDIIKNLWNATQAQREFFPLWKSLSN